VHAHLARRVTLCRARARECGFGLRVRVSPVAHCSRAYGLPYLPYRNVTGVSAVYQSKPPLVAADNKILARCTGSSARARARARTRRIAPKSVLGGCFTHLRDSMIDTVAIEVSRRDMRERMEFGELRFSERDR